jgi:hypothetical protein
MKKIYILPALISALLFTSCSDFLTEDVRGQENLDTYFQTEAEAESFVTGCYNALTFNGWWQVNTVWLLSEMTSDDGWMGNTTQQSDYTSLAFFQSNGQSNGLISNFWQYRYKGILRCNIVISKMAEAPIADEAKKARLIAEAKFLRAFYYFELVKNFGGVPIVETFAMPDEIQGVTRNTEEEVYLFIEKDLEEAAAVLPQRSSQSDSEIGRATRGAALGLLGKVSVYQSKWAEAKETLKTLIDEGEYALLDNFGDVWDVDHDNSVESLFEVQFTYDGVYALGGSLPIVAGNRSGGDQDGWAWGLPSANLENAYVEAGDSERLRWTIIRHGATEIAGEPDFEEVIELQGDQNGDGSYAVDPSKHKSARLMRKYYIPLAKRPEVFNTDKVPLNHRLLRYADILLLYAEACNETNDDVAARAALNQVRRRVDLSDVTAGGNDLRRLIRAERRLELAFEQNRLYDIRRWRDDNGKKVMSNLMGENGTFVKWNNNPATRDAFEWENQRESSDKGSTYREDRDLLFPVPLYEITMSNGSITQNPGWN